jgi:carbohydrate-binding DOMON domain-containing protein
LSNPRWHPEYGFQLTFAAIAVRFNDNPAGKGRELGMNSNVIVPEDYAFDRLIAVGGGVRVSDGTGKILAEYVPQPGDEKNPLGNASTGTVAFSIPRELLTTAEDNWTFAVFVGAQDDHGGAGIGEFRSVERLAGEWVGGGRKRPSDPNIFDTLFTGQPQQHSHP